MKFYGKITINEQMNKQINKQQTVIPNNNNPILIIKKVQSIEKCKKDISRQFSENKL
jgi:hypothetical protein